MGKQLFERSKHFGSNMSHEPAKRTKLHLFGILGAIVGIIAAVGIILVLTQMKTEKQIQAPLQIEEKQNNAERPLCNNKGTYLLCMCSTERNIIGSCSEKPSNTRLAFYNASISNGALTGRYLSSEHFVCSWNKIDAFAHFVPLQNLCGDTESQIKYCEEAAKTRPECKISLEQKEMIDKELQQCDSAAGNVCKGEFLSSDISEYIDASSMESGPIEATS